MTFRSTSLAYTDSRFRVSLVGVHVAADNRERWGICDVYDSLRYVLLLSNTGQGAGLIYTFYNNYIFPWRHSLVWGWGRLGPARPASDFISLCELRPMGCRLSPRYTQKVSVALFLPP